MKESKTIKIMKGSKNRRELTQVKTIYIYIFFFFLHINKQTKSIYYDNGTIDISSQRKSTLKNIVSGCVVHSEHQNQIEK